MLDVTTSAVEGYIYGYTGNDIVRLEGDRPGVFIDTYDGNDLVIRGETESQGYSASFKVETFLGGGADTLYGGAYGDIVNESDGNDVLHGFSGNDEFRLGGENNQVYGGLGDDEIEGGASGKFYGGKGEDTIRTFSDKDGSGDILIDGGSGSDEINVQTLGNATIRGGKSADMISVGGGEVLIDCGAGSDYIYVYQGNHTIRGGDGRDDITVYGGGKTIYGGAGNDIFHFGLGKNTVTGGSGDDKFEIFGDRKQDVITDFGNGNDVLALRPVEATSFIGADAFSRTKGEVRYVQSTGILSGDKNGDGVADWSVRLANKAALTADDFLF